MNTIKIADTTLCREGNAFSFKEKLEIARHLERLGVDRIELPEIENSKIDTLLVRTVSSFVQTGEISVAAGKTAESVTAAAEALAKARYPRIRIELPVSPVGMEYTCHRKPPKMLLWIQTVVQQAAESRIPVEFCAVDATRAEEDFLIEALCAAVKAGADTVTVCDSAAEMLPDEFAAFAARIAASVEVPVGVRSCDKNGMACAQAMMAVCRGIACVKTAVGGETVSLSGFATLLHNCGERYGVASGLRYTECRRIIQQIEWITDGDRAEHSVVAAVNADADNVVLDAQDDLASVSASVVRLGYDLSEEDMKKVYEEFSRLAAKKTVGSKELDVIVASVALQVPATYHLENYVISSSNVLAASAQITVTKDGKTLQGICLGNGPIDAAFRAVDQITGRHYELDDFQIQSVTEGREAMGSALVKLRCEGSLYSGKGVSTDIIGASIRAYLDAVNKIVYEEA